MNTLPSLIYKRRFRLSGEHFDSITVLSFNPTGTLLASGGIDGRLCLWSTTSGKAMHIITGRLGFLCAAWVDDQSLFVGMEDGVLLLVQITQLKLIASGFPLHTPPLECVSQSRVKSSGILLATGAHAELRIWETTSGDVLSLTQTLPNPPSLVGGPDQSIIVTSLHWAHTHFANALIASYLYHGILVWNAITGEKVRSIPVKTVGDTCLSLNQRLLSVYNLSDGFDVYDLSSHMSIIKHIDNEKNVKGGKLFLPVKFIHRDTALFGGSSSGWIPLWSAHDSHAEASLQNLALSGRPVVLAIDGHLNPETERFLLAAGTAGEGSSTRIQIWEAQEPNEIPNVHTNLIKQRRKLPLSIMKDVPQTTTPYLAMPPQTRTAANLHGFKSCFNIIMLVLIAMGITMGLGWMWL